MVAIKDTGIEKVKENKEVTEARVKKQAMES